MIFDGYKPFFFIKANVFFGIGKSQALPYTELQFEDKILKVKDKFDNGYALQVDFDYTKVAKHKFSIGSFCPENQNHYFFE